MIQPLVLKNLVKSEEYLRQTIPFIKPEYFEEEHFKIIFTEIDEFFQKYNALPTKKALLINISKKEIAKSDVMTQRIVSSLSEIFSSPDDENSDEHSFEWLLATTEEWCQERALYLAIIESLSIIDAEESTNSKHGIPKILQDALAVSFDNYVGHDYIENFKERYDFYHKKENKLPFDIDLLNKITNGGVSDKTFNLLMGVSGSGKSLWLCHFAASYLMLSKNVLYITMEMAEERIAERIDANLMNCAVNELNTLPEPIFTDRVETIANKTKGRLIIKEYPTGTAHSGHFRALLNELKMKKEFVPDVILIDYLNICSSSRIKSLSSSVNTYSLIKAVAEELRGLAVEFNVPIWSATQANRQAVENSDVNTSNVSESFGTVQTVDLMLIIISTEELSKRGQYLVKQGKNRYNNPEYYNKFFVGVNKSHMKLFNLEESAATTVNSTYISPVEQVIDSNADSFDVSNFKF